MTDTSILEKIGHLPAGIRGIHSAPLTLDEPFVEIARRFAQQPGTVALMSGGTSDCARYHILGVQPRLTITASGRAVEIATDDGTVSMNADPFDVLRALMQRFALPSKAVAPLGSGLLGYFAYDLKDLLEELPRTSVDDLRLPHLYMTLPSLLLVHDRVEGQTAVHLPIFEGVPEDRTERLKQFEIAIRVPVSPANDSTFRAGGFSSPFERQEYMDAVQTVREYIADGHVYQVNMSQRFRTTFEGDPFELYAKMFAVNPAPFFAYINAGDHQVLSTSPERFIALCGKAVETRPIKGTRPRGKTPEEDLRMKEDLQSSPKDDAELSMIVDLLRNDIGKVCAAGSVHVAEHKRLEAYENVYHLVTDVKGTLDDDKDAIDLIQATFPGGSITGCPKIRSMEIIDELEPVRRHIYTGSIGYLGFDGNLDLSIAIRTATVTNGQMVFSVGGGIVYDSNPADEYEETLHKGRTLMRSIDAYDSSRFDPVRYAWHNGIVKPSSKITISAEDEGFLYGYGFFETLRVQNGVPAMLEEHLARFSEAWRVAFPTCPPPDLTWDEIIAQLIEKNGLSDTTAAVKILAAAGKPPASSAAQTLLVTAREYRHRLAGTTRDGLRLAVYPHGRQSPLSRHKTMNYMLYKTAGQWAAERGADEAVILDSDRAVSETNTANIFCVIDGAVVCPESDGRLPGTMEYAVRTRLHQWDRSVTTRKLFADDLKRADHLFLTNSLMGAVPVIQLDDTPIKANTTLCQQLNQAIFE